MPKIKAIKNKFVVYLITFFVVVVSAIILNYALSALIIFNVNRYNADAKKAPLQHKYSNWIGNGQALRKYLPDLLAQAKGLNSRNIKAYLIIDQNVKTFLANTAPTPEELTAIHTIFHNYDLQPPTNAHNYAEYCQQNGLILINDTDVFDTLERELSEHYIPEFRKMYDERLQIGHQNGKDYAFAGDILRIAALQHIGKAGEVVMYTDADVGVDYRKIKDLVSVNQRNIEMPSSYGCRHLGHRAINAESLRKLFKGKFGIFNDVFATTAKMSTLSSIIKNFIAWDDIEKKLPVYSFVLNDNQNGNMQGEGYSLNKLKLHDFSFDLGGKVALGAINFIAKKDLKNIQPFFYAIPFRVFPSKYRKLRKQINSLKIKDPRSYALISPFMRSGDYVLFDSTRLSGLGLFTATIGVTFLENNREMQLFSRFCRDPWLTDGVKVAIFKAITLDPEEFGVIKRYEDVSWDKSGADIHRLLRGPLYTIYNSKQLYEWLQFLKDHEVL